MEKSELVKKLYAKIDELPALPAAVSRLLALLQSSEPDNAELVGLIETDPALTSKLLQVANSAYYGFSQKIDSVDRALAVLGLNMLQSLALSMGVVGTLPRENKSDLLSFQGLWLHSVATSVVIKEMGRRLGLGHEDDHLFVVGLLHDVGKIVLPHFFFDRYQQALGLARDQEDTPLYLAERRVIGIDHGEVGGILLKRWRFPDRVVASIMAHHRHDQEASADPRDSALLHLANQVPRLVEIGADGNKAQPRVNPRDLDLLGMGSQDLDQVLAFAESSRDNIQALFNAVL